MAFKPAYARAGLTVYKLAHKAIIVGDHELAMVVVVENMSRAVFIPAMRRSRNGRQANCLNMMVHFKPTLSASGALWH